MLNICENEEKKLIAKLKELEQQVITSLAANHVNPAIAKAIKTEIDALIDQIKKQEKNIHSLISIGSNFKNPKAQDIESFAKEAENAQTQSNQLNEQVMYLETRLQAMIANLFGKGNLS